MLMNILFLNFDFEINAHGIEDVDNILRGSKTSSELFSKILKEKNQDINPVFEQYQNIYMIGDSLYQNQFDIKNFNFVFFGFISKDRDMQKIIENYLLKHKVPYLKYGGSNHKLNDLNLIKELGYNYIPTLVTASINENLLGVINDDYKFPVVVKYPHIQKGAGVFLVKNKKDLINKFKFNTQPLLIQKFIENDGDFRIIVFKNKFLLSSKRLKTQEDEFRNNVALGGMIINEKPPKEVIEMCETISNSINFCDVLGFDVIQDKNTGKYYIMEINTGPHFFSFSVLTKIDAVSCFCDYMINNKSHVKVGQIPIKTDIQFTLCKKPEVKLSKKKVDAMETGKEENKTKKSVSIGTLISVEDLISRVNTVKSFIYNPKFFLNKK
jgi:hypothetical protein